MGIYQSIFKCTGIRVSGYSPKIGNSVSLEIATQAGPVELNLYDLPKSVTERLVETFGDEDTRVDIRDASPHGVKG